MVSNFSTDSKPIGSIVGLTGGIGSGKSTVALIFASLGVPVWDADFAGRRLYTEDRSMQQWVVNRYGKQCGVWLNEELIGIDRKALAHIVFNDDDALRELNGKVHPLVHDAFTSWMNRMTHVHHAPYVIRESAILFESNSHEDCDHVISVIAKEALRIERVTSRDHLKADDIRARIKHQLPDSERVERSTFVIENNECSKLLAQVLDIHNAMIA
jgi:dephospho-CoA kinase